MPLNRKEIKKRRKKYAREEKQSIKKQKREIRQKKRAFRKRQRARFFEKVLSYFSGDVGHTSTDPKPEELKKRKRRIRRKNLQRFIQGIISVFTPRPERARNRAKLRQRKKLAREYRRQEVESIKKERRQMKEKMRPRLKKMRQERFRYMTEKFISGIKHPLPEKKAPSTSQIAAKAARKEARKERYRDAFRKLTFVFESASLRKEFFATALNSTVFFIFGFLTIYFINQVVTILTARFFEIPAVLYYYRIYWPLYTYSSLYTRTALIVIFATGPLLSLILGFVFYRLFLIFRFKTKQLKNYFLWTSIQGFNFFFGAYIVGVITRTGFIYTSEWLFLSNIFDIEEIVFLILSIIALLVAGSVYTRQFLFASNSQNIIEPRIRSFYIFSKVLLPWIAGFLLFYLINIPNNPLYLILKYATLFFVVMTVFSNYNSSSNQFVKIPKKATGVRVAWVSLILCIAVLLIYRFLMVDGVRFD